MTATTPTHNLATQLRSFCTSLSPAEGIPTNNLSLRNGRAAVRADIQLNRTSSTNHGLYCSKSSYLQS